jgi:hypothetical protein
MFTEGSSMKLYISPNIHKDDLMEETLNNDEGDEKCIECSVGKLKGSDSMGDADVDWQIDHKVCRKMWSEFIWLCCISVT